MKRHKNLFLFIILLLAGFFRFYQLDQVPPSPSLDEVSIGWNAYSILKTGKDEYGAKLPILLRAYDDWRPALYVYLVVPFVKFIGLSSLAVRLPAVILSLITLFAVYFLIKELFPSANYLPGLTTFLLAISPWHIYISRLGHEVNAGLAFSVLAILFFLKSLRKKQSIFLFLSAIFFAFSFYTYQSQKIFEPLIIISLGLIFRKRLLEIKKQVFLAGLLGLILIGPIFKASLSSETLIRFQGTNIFSSQQENYQRSSLRIARDYQQNHILGLIFDNRRIAGGLTVLRAYFSHFDFSWLFFNTGEENHKIPGMGALYLWELPLILIGIYQLAAGKFSRKRKLLIFSWLLIAPLPASIATEAPHVMRTFNVLPVPQILAALGGIAVWKKFQKPRKKLFLAAAAIFLLLNLAYLYHNYFVNFPHEQSKSFQYPLAQAIRHVLVNEENYQKIVFSNKGHCYQSYMFFLFFSRYDPFIYFRQGGTISGGYAETHKIGKHEFRPIEWGKEVKSKDILYIGNVNDFPEEKTPLAVFKLLNNQEAIKVNE